MLWNRGGQGDYQDWVDLGNPGWGWDDMLPYFRRSETYTPVYSEEIAEDFSIQEWPDAHGFDGPVNVSFPKYFWNSSAVLFDALNELGIPTAYDPNTGLLAGASFLPMDIDPVTEERSTARRAYYDPIMDRPNLWVSTEQTVTQLIFGGQPMNAVASTPIRGDTSVGEGDYPGIPTGIFGGTTTLDFSRWNSLNNPPINTVYAVWYKLKRRLLKSRQENVDVQVFSPATSGLRVTGVEFAPNAGALRRTVSASREVIVAAGALHSPQLLMLSGIGPAAKLEPHNISVKMDLPGVGSNLQEYASAQAIA
jgi:choline dehydrogenase